MDEDYKDFVERMGSFDMDIEEIPQKEEPLTHWGITRKSDMKDAPLIGATVYIKNHKK